MCRQGAIDFLEHGFAQAGCPDPDNRVQMMRGGFQPQPLIAGQRQFSHLMGSQGIAT
jgi:hypothetical protein